MSNLFKSNFDQGPRSLGSQARWRRRFAITSILTLATESSSLSIPTAVSIPPKIWTSALKGHRRSRGRRVRSTRWRPQPLRALQKMHCPRLHRFAACVPHPEEQNSSPKKGPHWRFRNLGAPSLVTCLRERSPSGSLILPPKMNPPPSTAKTREWTQVDSMRHANYVFADHTQILIPLVRKRRNYL